MTTTQTLPANPFILAMDLGLPLMTIDEKLNHTEQSRLDYLSRTHDEAICRAAQWLAELDEGRGFGVMTREYISDLLALCAAIIAWLGR